MFGKLSLSNSALHILAMVFMLCDHMWATVIPGNQWLTCVGRLAFPIFAFLIVEGYFHTSNLRKYVLRLLLCAIISEIPFNLMYSSSVINPFHQNVIWTLLMGLGWIHLNERVKKRGNKLLSAVVLAVSVFAGYLLGIISFADYNGAGVATILVFYILRKRSLWCFLGQVVLLYYINVEVLSGLYFEIAVGDTTLHIVQQGLALFALIPIWLYNGRKGYHSRWFQYVCYGFYPVHMLALHLLRSLIV